MVKEPTVRPPESDGPQVIVRAPDCEKDILDLKLENHLVSDFGSAVGCPSQDKATRRKAGFCKDIFHTLDNLQNSMSFDQTNKVLANIETLQSFSNEQKSEKRTWKIENLQKYMKPIRWVLAMNRKYKKVLRMREKKRIKKKDHYIKYIFTYLTIRNHCLISRTTKSIHWKLSKLKTLKST
ncbi:Hypothetical predicted protein [Octopus vulgaris]|uniref:Uncharacterized protein n=1 Tax=Octopus vulgaris TaxID=6645 RepID=A0AA36BJI9_OCTVU|nr:Hypothetical predicted protein [Octopus vulgaris]